MSKTYKVLLLNILLFFVTNEIWMAQPSDRKVARSSRASSSAKKNPQAHNSFDGELGEWEIIGSDDDDDGELICEFSGLDLECKMSKEEIKEILKNLAISGSVVKKLMQEALKKEILPLVQALVELGYSPANIENANLKKIRNVALKHYLKANFDLLSSKHCLNAAEKCKKALKNGAYVNVREVFGGATPLHGAAYHREVEMVKVLIDSKADVNAKDEGKWTPLHVAIVRSMHAGKDKEQRLIIKLLLANGARVDIKNDEECTALDLAREFGFEAEFGIK